MDGLIRLITTIILVCSSWHNACLPTVVLELSLQSRRYLGVGIKIFTGGWTCSSSFCCYHNQLWVISSEVYRVRMAGIMLWMDRPTSSCPQGFSWEHGMMQFGLMSRLDVVVSCEDFSSQSPKGSAGSVTSGFSEKKEPYVSVARKPAFMNSTSSTFTT